jgi:D-alanyl-D-alanine carboxypeptidase
MRRQPDFRPGEKFGYSHTNYILAGMIIQAATGHTWRQILVVRIDQVADPHRYGT